MTTEKLANMLEESARIRQECKTQFAQTVIDAGHEATIARLTAERDELRRCLEVSEDFRKAYQDGKYKMYAQGGLVCEAAASFLPCGEGPLDRKADSLLGVAGLKAMIVDLTAKRDAARNQAEVLATALHRQNWDHAQALATLDADRDQLREQNAAMRMNHAELAEALLTAEKELAEARIALAGAEVFRKEIYRRSPEDAEKIANSTVLRQAIKAWAMADDTHVRCEECMETGRSAEACGECFPSADDARVLMRKAFIVLGLI
jgi:hypothetical protein